MGAGKLNAGDNPEMDWHPIQRGVEILPVASYCSNRDKLRPDEPLGSSSHLTLLYNQKLILIYQRKNSEKNASKRYELHKYHTKTNHATVGFTSL